MGVFKTPKDLSFMTGNKTIPGGHALSYGSRQLFIIKADKNIGETYGFGGTSLTFRGVKNKLFTPNIEVGAILSFEMGFSNFWTNYEFLKTAGRIKTGAWCSLIDYPEKKFRQNQVIGLYREDEKFKELFDNNVKDALKTEIIDKYKSTKIEDVDI
jgi:hypothetical protein